MARKRQNNNLPTFDELIIPTAKALVSLGGSGSVEEINNKVYEIAAIPENVLLIPHGEKGTINEVDYRLAWIRTYLKKFGLLENSSRGIWALSKSNIDPETIDAIALKRAVREQFRASDQSVANEPEKITDHKIDEEVENTEQWKDQLLNILYKIPAEAFERLAQRLLRESGFFQVE